MRVSQGLEALNSSMESSTTTYLRQEAFFKLENNKNTEGTWSDNDAIAALHLVSFSQLSGASIDWEIPFNILSQWLMQQNLVQSNSGNPWMAFLALSPLAQILVKATIVSLKLKASLLRPAHLWSTVGGCFLESFVTTASKIFAALETVTPRTKILGQWQQPRHAPKTQNGPAVRMSRRGDARYSWSFSPGSVENLTATQWQPQLPRANP